ncbi:RNA-directed DNA polymerase, eukaryota, reverse transcriptase zinc-binding domain protein [Tanacetum coccineum]
MEGLHNAFVDAVGNGLVSGININNSSINISHLFFADDVIITTSWNTRVLKNIIRVLHVFYLASGPKINIHKSNIYSIGVNEDDVYNMDSNARCIAGNIPFNYLGLLIGSNMKSIATWKMLIDRFRSRLSTWKASLLSIGGRLTLIKYVLRSLGIYYLSIFRAPESVLNDLERIWSNFFWGGNQDGKKMAWVKWPIILNSYDNEGLNIVVKAFHGHGGGFDNNGCSFKGTWANIVESSNFLHSKGIILNNSFRFNAGCETRIRFWKDIWVGEAPLSRLYRLDQDKDCLIIDRIINRQWHWNWSRTNIGVRNLSFFGDMLNEIGQLNIVASEDTCVWNLGPNGTFTVKDARNIIDQKTLPSLSSTSWDKIIPRKVNIFMWRLSLDRLPHRLNLSLRGMDIPAISCSSCNANRQFDFILDGLAKVPSNDRVFGQWLNALFQKAAFLSRLLSRGLFEAARNEVGCILKANLKDKVVHMNMCSDRIMSSTLVIDKETVSVISVYAPQVSQSEEENKTLRDSLDETVREFSTDQRLIIGDDLYGHTRATSDGYPGVHGGIFNTFELELVLNVWNSDLNLLNFGNVLNFELDLNLLNWEPLELNMYEDQGQGIKVDDMTISEYLEYEETLKTQDYDGYQPHPTKAGVSARHKNHTYQEAEQANLSRTTNTLPRSDGPIQIKLHGSVRQTVVFLKMLRLWYHQLTVREEDIPKTAFRMSEGIHVDPSKIEAVKNWKPLKTPTEIRKANIVADSLSRKEWMKLRRARAMSMTIHSSIKTKILEAQSEASKDVNTSIEMLRGLDKQFERKEDGRLYFVERI